MKKRTFILAAAVVALTISSCAKDRVCTCKDEDGDESKVTLKEVTKSQAKANCVSRTFDAGNGVTFSETCELD